jgi:Tannase-like family of unknown function (DUF6351)
MQSRRWTFWRLCGASSTALALSACGGGGTDTFAGDMQAGMGAPTEAIDSGAAAHDATIDHRPSAQSRFVIRTLGNRADLISDGDALVEIQVPQTVPLNKVKVTLNDADITGAFTANASAKTLRGVVKGLRVGKNELLAQTVRPGKGHGFGHRNDDDVSLIITNHPRGGPVLLGSQTQPWICATPTPVAQSGDTPASNASGLSTFAVDAQCNIATEFKLFYRTTTAGCSSALPDPSPPATPPTNNCFKPYTMGVTPVDLAMTTTSDGKTVPYIVRVERGTLNRGIYDIVVLFDPAQPWNPLSPQPQWNGKVVYSYGASTGQPRLQFRTEQNWADDTALSRGFMVVDNSVTDSLYNSNRVLVAETTMMMKEHIVDSYGEIKYTMGNGCSGGSIQQNTVASIYPGLLDGIQPSCDYPDSITTGMEVTDCVLLVNAYAGSAWQTLMTGLTQAQVNTKKTAINGHLDQTACHGWTNLFGSNNQPGNYVPIGVVDNTTGALGPIGAARNNCGLPASMVYDPVTNPDGTRCGDPDLATAVWGTTDNENAPGHKRALQTLDNVGIQYGLGALKSGAITAEEFITLNEKIGGVDKDNKLIAQRATADLRALSIAYRGGIVGSGKNLGKLPIIDSRGYDEIYGNLAAAQYGIHQYWRSYSERARIDADNGGNHGNQLIWRYGYSLVPVGAAQTAAVTTRSFLTMDSWLTTLLSTAPKSWINDVRTQAEVIAAKPADPAALAFDLCYLSTDLTFSTPITDQAMCDADLRLQKHSSPRQVAGGPLAENILKCQLKPINTADYLPVTFTAEQLTRLYATFPDGVCDWSKPGVSQQPARSPLTFAGGPGGRRLPPAPGSQGSSPWDHDD